MVHAENAKKNINTKNAGGKSTKTPKHYITYYI